MTQLPKKTQKNWDTNKSKRTHTQKHTGPITGLYELVLVAVHIENFQCTA